MGRQEPYDRQPFTHLEEIFRRAGEVNLAQHIYYEGKRQEAEKIRFFRSPFVWLGNRLLWALTGYGVQLANLLAAFAIVLILGTVLFHFNGAVIQKEPPRVVSQASQQIGPLPYTDAFGFATRLLLPVEIPYGAAWEPSRNPICMSCDHSLFWNIRFATVASLLKLFGWILVPIWVAGLTGIIKR